jgi:hypothetical protein
MPSELTPTYDSDTGQVILDGLPTGAAGEAALIPVPELELVFDRVDGRLARVTVGMGQPDSQNFLSDASAAVLSGLLGPQAPAVISDAARDGTQRPLSPDTRLSAVLSRLARLDSARVTSRVPTSPLWAAEAAQLAVEAGLHGRARRDARRAAADLADLLHLAPPRDALAKAACAVADLIEADEPRAAEDLRDLSGKLPAMSVERWLAGQPTATTPENVQQWSLDPSLVPEGVFLPGLSPLADLGVHPGNRQNVVIVQAFLAPGADREALRRCRARLVDPSARRVLASASMVLLGSRAWAELTPPFPVDELKQTWVEVVGDAQRPVRSEHLRRMRRALRWADAALRAEQHPRGLAPHFTGQDWAALAATAWERCSHDWEDTGDTDRAFLASLRHALYGPAARVPEPPSAWVAALAARSPLSEPAFLAEAIGH